ncbi:cytochrome c3 family protein [Neorhodopirellula lusitana]|uniref:hypothetical protein n=1 Tax=Neorhodopirellula lusitana TaxID=445327 RepID=UPI00384C5666
MKQRFAFGKMIFRWYVCAYWIIACFGLAALPGDAEAAGGGRQFAHSDSDKRYLHYIDLYDANNRKITADSTTPYSPVKTCGRCHDYETISHGWHFNAFRSHALGLPQSEPNDDAAADSEAASPVHDGRQGEPWIWTDERTGTQLPLSYRDWPDLFHPSEIGIDPFAMTRHFGARTPGGSTGMEDARSLAFPDLDLNDAEQADAKAGESASRSQSSRWQLTGDLDVDCMVCHAVSGAYDFELRRDTIGDENFAWAPTAALRLGDLDGSVARIKDGSDPEDERVQAKLPKVSYNPSRFNADGKVFMDLVRKVENNACYQCHSQRTVSINQSDLASQPESGDDPQSIETPSETMTMDSRWIHDQDVHIRAGMQCTDCHRNGIDHHIVRGFEGEARSSGPAMTTLSCAGCHLGTDFYLDEDAAEASVALKEIANRSGRLGSPLPRHEGLPPIHFEKLACTACHSGPIPGATAGGIMTSLSHGLGSSGHRSGEELPSIRGPLFVPLSDVSMSAEAESATDDDQASGHEQPRSRTAVARGMWPAFWGKMQEGEVVPLPPEEVYTATRRALRVRRGFIAEITKPTLEDEKKKTLFDEKVYAGLTAIEKEFDVAQAVYVSTGKVFAKSDTEDQLKEIAVSNSDKIDMVRWPMAHNVRPAGWSLGATGCLECHSDDGVIFASTVTPVGPAPVVAGPVTMASLQGIDDLDRQVWSELFAGRSTFKILTTVSLLALAIMILVGIATKTFSLVTRSAPTNNNRSR